MFTLTRQDAADTLKISTRSIDRYIKSGKVRSKKIGKIVYIHDQDIQNILGGGSVKQEVIIPGNSESTGTVNSTDLSTGSEAATLSEIYKDLRSEIKKKDELIQDLSMKVGRAEEITKNSISLIEFKKSQFLLEESKTYLNKELNNLQKSKKTLQEELKYEKTSNKILIVFVIMLLILAASIWFVKI